MINTRRNREISANRKSIDALSWKAAQLKTSYGKLTGSLTYSERETVVAEYSKYLEAKLEEENRRLDAAD